MKTFAKTLTFVTAVSAAIIGAPATADYDAGPVAPADIQLYDVTPDRIKAERIAYIESLDIDSMSPAERDVVYMDLVGSERFYLVKSVTNGNSLYDDFSVMGMMIVPYVHGKKDSVKIFGY